MATHKAATKKAGQARNRRAVRAGRELAEILSDGVAYQTGYAVESWRTQALTAAGGGDPAPPVQPHGLFNRARWESTLAETFDYITRFTVDELETDFGIRVTQDQPFVTRIAERLVASIDGWMDDFKARVGRAISDGHAAQASVNQVADTLEERGVAFGRRATAIARTEMVAASNQASLHGALAFAQPGDTKVWMSTSDSRTRDDHRHADGQEVPVEEPFIVGGERGDVPGDTSFTPEQRANCRCTFTWKPADNAGSGGTTPTGETTALSLGESAPLPTSPTGSAARYITNGQFTDTRRRQHEAVVRDALAGVKPSTSPTFTFVGGGVGSNPEELLSKTQTAAGSPGEYVLIDPRRLARLLPESKVDGFDFTTDEVNYLAERIATAARENGMNYAIVLDSAAPSDAVLMMKSVEKLGYTTNLVIASVDTNTAIRRARHQSNRREIAPVTRDDIVQSHKWSKTMLSVGDRVATGQVELWDNNDRSAVGELIANRRPRSSGSDDHRFADKPGKGVEYKRFLDKENWSPWQYELIDQAEWRPKERRFVQPMFSEVEKLHGARHDTVPIEKVSYLKRTKNAPGEGGFFSYVTVRSSGRILDTELAVRDRGVSEENDFNMWHEIGHWQDFSATTGEFVSTEAINGVEGEEHDAMRAFFKTVGTSDAIETIRDSEESRGGKLSKQYVDYLLDEREIWARAYSQWVVVKTEGMTGRHGKWVDRVREAVPGFQWDADEFEAEIAPMVEEVLRARGVLNDPTGD